MYRDGMNLPMKITFLGGAETVTGSKYLVETKTTRVLVDCGLFQGYKWLRKRNWQPLAFDVDTLDAVLLTHAHLDHSGYLPALYKQGFRGPVFTHHATKALCKILLEDSGHIQEEDARFYTRHKLSKHKIPKPLYDKATAKACMRLFESVDFEQAVSIGDIEFNLQYAGHILGAASIILTAEGKKVGFTGDVGRPNDILMKPPKALPHVDVLLLESTYGNRRHEATDPFEQLANVVAKTAAKGGVLLVPSFAVGRAQMLQHMFVNLMTNQLIPILPVYLDSPMAINVSDIYHHFCNEHKLDREQCEAMTKSIIYTATVDQSKAIESQHFPHIIIAGSGMATGGRILHHFSRLLSNPKTTVLFTGYQAGGTRGAKMLAGAKNVKLHGKWIPVKADVTSIDDLSGHADYADMTNWLKSSPLGKKLKIYLVHGDPDALEGMRDHLRQETSFEVEIAVNRQILTI
jgi:metallo-beta-lactamase family protein